jgi:inner membrane protein
MASVFTHFIVGAALALSAIESVSIRGAMPRWVIPVSSGLMAVAPDLDTFVMRALGIPYSSFFGHRGFFHSPFFLIVFSAILAAMAARRHAWIAILWAGCAITHPLLDALTDGGSGVMLLFPFSEARLFFPWTPIHVSPLGAIAFFRKAGYILRSEVPFCAVAIAIGVLGLLARRSMRSA